ncbi:CamS family sex pheromone protein [Oceanobacillus profundus]|uniref:CamS family sex pheromone protein n=1 Tax=Oceanobacillus profundus TaxID=372463 RepID=A0A417YCE9_9BACI|nr:CamS family sex pheromone protein [Oceanobacillus profundus]RHW30216.1 CamS family sex pheromone protein [Oceanobacillus profundus]
MKRTMIWFLGTLLILASCAPNMEEETSQKTDNEQEVSVLSSQSSKETYRMIAPYKTNVARGLITNQISNRVDIDEIEEGLKHHSQDVFDPSELYFQEGQYLTEDIILSWITDLNPAREDDWDVETHRKNPRIFSHVLEHNYLRQVGDKEVELAGISIGIALKSVYHFRVPVNGDPYSEEIEMNAMLEKGYEVAQVVLENMRETEGLSDIPFMFTLYREEDPYSPVPGNFVAKTSVPGGSNSIEDWETINEEHILFPSSEGEKKYPEEHEILKHFGNEIAQYFPNYVGIVGDGFYVDEELQSLKIEIPIEASGKTELIGFMQYAYGLVQDVYENYYELEINITSGGKVVGLIYREAGGDSPEVHVIH